MQLKQTARDALLKPLQAVSGIVERRHTLPILANVLLEQKDGRLYVTATDLEMQITAHSELPGKEAQSVTVAARKLQDLLRALPEDISLNVETAGSRMTVRAGRSRFNLQTLPAVDYPRIGQSQDQVQALALPQRDLRGLLKSVEFAMALAKELTQLSLPEIGSNFGGRDHTTVLHACRQIAKLRETHADLNHDVNFLLQVLRS